MLCELAEKLMRSGTSLRPGSCGSRLTSATRRRLDLCAGWHRYGDIGDHAAALEWLTTGLELALRTGDPESALEQLRPLRASCLSALGPPPDEIQQQAARSEEGNTDER
jgi:hypothetical protein